MMYLTLNYDATTLFIGRNLDYLIDDKPSLYSLEGDEVTVLNRLISYKKTVSSFEYVSKIQKVSRTIPLRIGFMFFINNCTILR
jgi:hypothetical protein